jgi:hypothetical protein
MAWLHTSVLPTVQRLGASDDDQVRQWVAAFLEACNEEVEHEQVDDLDDLDMEASQ